MCRLLLGDVVHACSPLRPSRTKQRHRLTSKAFDISDLEHHGPRVACSQLVAQRFWPQPPGSTRCKLAETCSVAQLWMGCGMFWKSAVCIAALQMIANPRLVVVQIVATPPCGPEHQSWRRVAPGHGCATLLPDGKLGPTPGHLGQPIRSGGRPPNRQVRGADLFLWLVSLSAPPWCPRLLGATVGAQHGGHTTPDTDARCGAACNCR